MKNLKIIFTMIIMVLIASCSKEDVPVEDVPVEDVNLTTSIWGNKVIDGTKYWFYTSRHGFKVDDLGASEFTYTVDGNDIEINIKYGDYEFAYLDTKTEIMYIEGEQYFLIGHNDASDE